MKWLKGQKVWLRAVILAACALILAGALAALTFFVILPAGRYARAASLAASDPARAFDAFERMDGYRNAEGRMQELRDEVFATRSVEYMEFGGREWLVLEERDGNALLLLRDVLPERAYHEALVGVTWEDSNIRQYLNGAFLNGFDQQYRARIIETEVVNTNNADFGTSGGNNTRDYIFLLSLAEANFYFESAAARIARHEGSTVHAVWWLRSPGLQQETAAMVRADGELGRTGSGVNATNRTVRPAMWVRLG